jgi:hypothetical protein
MKEPEVLLLFVLCIITVAGCRLTPEDPGIAASNSPPVVRISNPPDDISIDSTGNDGFWNASTDDVGKDGIPDSLETGCMGAFDPVTNNDPSFDNYDPAGLDRCAPSPGTFKDDVSTYTEKNRRPDHGEPHVNAPHIYRSPWVRIRWNGNDDDGYVTAFMYRWSYSDSYSDSAVQRHPWTTVLNFVVDSRLVLLMDVTEDDAPRAAKMLYLYFHVRDLIPGTCTAGSPEYDSAYCVTLQRLYAGYAADVLGYRVRASNADRIPTPVHESPASGLFIFESNDVLNHHTFEVRGIDNESAVGPADTVRFWTRGITPPIVNFVYEYKATPLPTDTIFILDHTTPTWGGIQLTFDGYDFNNATIMYSWKIDNRPWSTYSPAKNVRITASDLDTPYTGTHVVQLRGRNMYGAITPENARPRIPLSTVYPMFLRKDIPQRVLIVSVNKNPPDSLISRSNPAEADIIRYYDEILTSLGIPHDIHNTRGNGHPSKAAIAMYSTVYFVSDNLPPEDLGMYIPGKLYSDYLGIGGKLLMNALAWTSLPRLGSATDSLLVGRLQLRDTHPPSEGGSFHLNHEFDCAGAFGGGRTGYPTLEVDTSKCDTFQTSVAVVASGGAIRRISICQPQGFAEPIYRFNSKVDSIDFENKPVGVRYIGSTYSAVWYGLPLYYVKKDQATEAIRKGLMDLGFPF